MAKIFKGIRIDTDLEKKILKRAEKENRNFTNMLVNMADYYLKNVN